MTSKSVMKANIRKILREINPEIEISDTNVSDKDNTSGNQSEINSNQSETHSNQIGTSSNPRGAHSDHRKINTENTYPTLAQTIHKLEAGIDHGTGSSSLDIKVGPSTGDTELPGACYGLWFNHGDPHSHVLEYKRWKQALKESALTYRAHEIMLEGLREEKEPNSTGAHRPWECDDSLHTHYTRATPQQLKEVLRRLTGKRYILTTEIATKSPIRLVKMRKGKSQKIRVKVKTSGTGVGIDRE